MRDRWAWSGASLLVLGLLSAGCGAEDDEIAGTHTASVPSTSAPTATTTTGGTPTTTVTVEQPDAVSVYLLQDDELVVGEGRAATDVDGADALTALLAGPTDLEIELGMTSAIPEGTRLLGVGVEGRVASVDLSAEFTSGGGSLSMVARIAQVVFTMTQFASVDAVRLLIDGVAVDTIGGEGVMVAEPLRRADFDWDGDFGDTGLYPPVLLESPRPGEEVESPLRITGSVTVYEAVFLAQVADHSGRIVAEAPVQPISQEGGRGAFDANIPFAIDRPGPGAIITSLESLEDGSLQAVQETPVRLR